MNPYGTKYLNRLTIPRRIAGNNDVPDMTMIIIIIFMKTSSTNNVIPLFLKRNFYFRKRIFLFEEIYLPN
jgi:hypothetical protein